MSEPIHIAKISIYQDERPNRRAYIGDFKDPFYYGIHGGVKDFYKAEPKKEYPSTLDHVISAAAG